MKRIIVLIVSLFFAGFSFSQVNNLSGGTGNERFSPYDSSFITQYHRIADITPANTNWNRIKFDTLIVAETTQGYSFNDDSTGFIVSYSGVMRVQGCFHTSWTGASNTAAKILCRTLVNTTEARCLQSSNDRERKSNDVDILPYVGTVAINSNDTVYVEYKVDNTSYHLAGDTDFDNPVAASVNFERIK